MVFHLFSHELDFKGHTWLAPNKAAPTASPMMNAGAASFHVHNMLQVVYDKITYVVACSYQSALHLLAVVNKRLVKLEANWQPFDEDACSSL